MLWPKIWRGPKWWQRVAKYGCMGCLRPRLNNLLWKAFHHLGVGEPTDYIVWDLVGLRIDGRYSGFKLVRLIRAIFSSYIKGWFNPIITILIFPPLPPSFSWSPSLLVSSSLFSPRLIIIILLLIITVVPITCFRLSKPSITPWGYLYS